MDNNGGLLIVVAYAHITSAATLSRDHGFQLLFNIYFLFTRHQLEVSRKILKFGLSMRINFKFFDLGGVSRS